MTEWRAQEDDTAASGQGEDGEAARVRPSNGPATHGSAERKGRAAAAQLAWSQQALSVQGELLTLIAQGRPLAECLEAITSAVSRLHPRTRACVLLANEAHDRFEATYAGEVQASFGAAIQGAPIEELAMGTCGRAAHRGEAVTSTDIAHDDRWAPAWRDLCVRYGILACHAEPAIGSTGSCVASLMLCFAEAREPDAREREFARFAAGIAAIAIERVGAEEIRPAHESGQAFLLLLSDALRPLGDPVAIQEAAIQLLGRRLGATRTLYAEFAVEAGQEYVVVEREHLAPGASSFAGRHPAEQFGSDLTELQAGRAFAVPDTESEAGTEEQRSIWRALGVRARLGVPLVKDGRLVAGLGVHVAAPRNWTPGELDLVREAAERTWAAVERARAQAALRESEELNRRVLTSSDDCIKLLDLDGRLQSMSEGGQRALAISDLVPFIGTVWAEAFEPEGRSAAHAAVAEARGGRSGRFEAKLRTQAGVLRDWDTVVTPILGDDGKPEKILALSRDITDRRVAEAILRESEARRAFLLSLGDLTRRLHDPAKIVEATTRAVGEHLNATRVVYAEIDEAKGQAVARGGWTDGAAAHLPEVVRLADFGDRLIARLRAGGALRVDDVRADDHARDSVAALEAIGVRALVSVPLFRDGRFVVNLNVHQDEPRRWTDAEAELIEAVAERTLEAVERSRADAALRASEARLGAIFAEALVGLSEIDLDGRFLSVNAKLCAMLGRSREEVTASTFAAVTHPEDVAISLEHFRQTIEIGRPVSFDKRYLRRDGSLVWANSNLTRLEDDEGRPRGVLAVTVDLTERQTQEAALREETRTLETLNRTGAQLAGELDLDRLLQNVTDASVELTGAQFGAYFHNVMDETGERLHLFTLSGAERDAFLAMGRPRATAIFGPTFRNETVIRSGDILADPRYGRNTPHKGMPEGHLPVRSYLAIPVVSRTGEVLGGLIFGHPEPDRFTERHERLMKGLAGQAAVAIDNARLYGIARSELEERRSAEARLRELNDTLEQRVAERTAERDRMWRATRDLMCVARVDGTLLSVNPAWERLLGWTESDLVGRNAAEIKHPDDTERTRAGLARLATGEPIDAFQDRYRHRDGSWRWISWSIEPAGDLIYCAGRDVTAEKIRSAQIAEAEAARREADALYRAYFENTAEALFVVNVLEDGGFSIEDLNPAHQSSIGLPLAQVQGKRIDEVLPPEMAAVVMSHYRRAIAAEGVYQYREEFQLHGRTTYWDTVLVPVRDSAGQIVRLIGASRDLTPQMAAEEQLRQSQKMEAMGQLTGGVAHDFNNLLTPIVGSLDMLMRRSLGSEREQRLIGGAMQSAERAKTLVQRLLAFARRQPLQPAAVHLPQLVNGMAGLIGSTLGPKIDVRVDLAHDLPPARADANQLEMALLNLAVNARDAMPDGGMLTISAARESVRPGHRSKLKQGHYLRLSVADTGTGMEPETLGRAIEPFFSTKGIGKGTGLGLSMAHGLAAQLGGGLTIASEIGLGTIVELWLPVSAEPLTDVDAPPAAPVSKGRGRALLVDDEVLGRMSTADMLGDLGYDVIEAGTGEEALQLLRHGAMPDLLVTDHLMPGMSGVELAWEARLLKADLQVLIVSGYAELDGIAPDLPRLTKPFRSAELAERLAGLRAARASRT